MVGSLMSPVQGGQFLWRRGLGGSVKKLKTGRTRTQSSDSGCDMSIELSEACLNSEIKLDEVVCCWTSRVEGVLRQEEERAREVTSWAKEALKQCSGITDQDEEKEKREIILQNWKGQIEGVLQFTSDLIDCVNTDTKEMINEELCNLDVSGHDSSSTIEEEFEDEDGLLEREIMQMFGDSKDSERKHQDIKERMGNKKLLKEFMAMYKKSRRKKSKKANKEVQAAYAKIKRQEGFNKRRHSSSESIKGRSFEVLPDPNYSTKMFDSVIGAEDLFSDWNWNFKEIDDVEQIFEEWRWNMEEPQDLKVKFYDAQGISEAWNDFHFWKPPTGSQEIDSGCLADSDDIDSWKNCTYWENTYTNRTIIKDLEDDSHYENNVIDTHNFWDESEVNQNIISSLIEQEETVKKEHKDIVLLWDDDKIIFSLLDSEDQEDNTPPIQFFSTYEWDDVNILNGLLENNKQIDKEAKENKREENDDNWNNWCFWDRFGTAEEIMKASEDIFQPEKNHTIRELILQGPVEEDLDEIFSEELSKILEDENRDKMKHILRKRGLYKKKKEDLKGLSSPVSLGHKRPGTPTILTVTIDKRKSEKGERERSLNYEARKRKQKGCQQACAVHRRRKLESKMRAKQPRAVY